MAHPIIRLALLALIASATLAHAQTKPAGFTTVREDWTDAVRERTLPVKIYLPASSDAKSPVIFLSHGLGGTRESMTYAGEAWARAGYFVVGLQHPGSDDSVWRGKPPAEVLKALQDAISAENYRLRCQDVSFAIDHLTELAQTDPRFKQRLDLDHIGLAGHSFGAQTVQGIVGQTFPGGRTLGDPRVKAAIAFSPGLKKEADAGTAFAKVNVPIFHFTGTKDQAPLVRDLTPAERRIPYDSISQNHQYLLIFQDGDHAVFNGTPQRRASRTVDDATYEKWHGLIIDASRLFWDAHLRGNDDAKTALDGFADSLGDAGTFEHKSNP